MRGTVDATGPGGGLSGFVAPPEPETITTVRPRMQSSRPALPDKVHMPKMRNAALPAEQPVTLVPLQAYPRSQRRGGPPPDEVPGPTVAALPVPLRHLPAAVEADPFAPIGVAVGGLRLFPYVQQSIGYDTNPEQINSGIKPSAYSRTEGGFALQSLWNGQDLRGTMYGAYDAFFSNPAADRPDANGVVDYVATVTRDTALDAEARFNVDSQRTGSPELNVDVVGRPLIVAFGGTFGGTQNFGRFSVGLHGLVDRTAYDNGVLANGHTFDLAYQNVNDYGLKLRVGYDLKPGYVPFVEITGDTRIHDDTVDIAGFRRDSDGIAARIGSSFEWGGHFTGTISAGYADRFYDDPRLKELAGPLADGSLVWAATPLTTLTLSGVTSFNETNVPGASGIESRLVSAALSHALFRYLTLTGALIYENDDYDGSPIAQNVLTESLKAEYHVSRWLVLTGTLSHQKLTSTVSGYNYAQSVALLGVRVQQ